MLSSPLSRRLEGSTGDCIEWKVEKVSPRVILSLCRDGPVRQGYPHGFSLAFFFPLYGLADAGGFFFEQEGKACFGCWSRGNEIYICLEGGMTYSFLAVSTCSPFL